MTGRDLAYPERLIYGFRMVPVVGGFRVAGGGSMFGGGVTAVEASLLPRDRALCEAERTTPGWQHVGELNRPSMSCVHKSSYKSSRMRLLLLFRHRLDRYEVVVRVS